MFDKALVVHKETTLDLLKKNQRLLRQARHQKKLFESINLAHDAHYTTISLLEQSLKKLKIKHDITQKNGLSDMIKAQGLCISVGGDGTFIHSSHSIFDVNIIGINSAPKSSVGHYCKYTLKENNLVSFSKKLEKLFAGKAQPKLLPRLQLTIDDQALAIPILNDLLIVDKNPSITSRYTLRFKNIESRQKSSGIWIATHSGSTGAYNSAKGKAFEPMNAKGLKQFGFVVREAYGDIVFKERTGLLNEKDTFFVTSEMLNGSVILDGGYETIPFNIGQNLEVSFHHQPLMTLEA